MNSLGLNLAANIMINSQKSLDIIGQNISNAQTPGYSRQEAIYSLVTYGNPFGAPGGGIVGSGSEISEIMRYRNTFLDTNYRRENNVGGEMNAKASYLEDVAEAFSDTADFGLPTQLNEFWQSWNRASGAPGDLALRDLVIQKGEILARSMRQKIYKLNDSQTRIDNEVSTTVDRINTIVKELASLNNEVPASLAKTYERNVIDDQRDRLLDELTSLTKVEIKYDDENQLSVYMDGTPLVAEKTAFPIKLQEDAAHKFHIMSAGGRELNLMGGKIKGLMDIRENLLPGFKAEMDALASSIINAVNSVHTSGYALDGTPGANFFTGTSASDIQVNISQPEKLALSSPTLTSTTSVNRAGFLVDPSLSLMSQTPNFTTAPAVTGTVRVNGVDVNWTNIDSIEDIMRDISNALKTSGSGITVNFDANAQKITFSAPEGTNTITITDTAGNFTQFMDLDGAVQTTGTPGDGTNGLRLFEIASKKIIGTPPSMTINEKYAAIVSDVGFTTSNAKNAKSVQAEYLDMLDSQRQESSGVNIDEEVVYLMRYQKSFQAGAKMTTIINEMYDSLFAMIR